MELLTLNEAMNVRVPIVYGLTCGSDNKIVYVGKTSRPKHRLEVYKYPSMCHNDQLKKWLTAKGKDVRLVILDSNPDDINKSEREWISKLRNEIYNLIGGGDQAWRQHTSYPWMAGTGIRCPSDLAILRIKSSNDPEHISMIGKIKSIRREMSMERRCAFEVGVCMDLFDMDKKKLSDWLDKTQHKILPILEKSLQGEA